MKIVITDSATVFDELVSYDMFYKFGDLEVCRLLSYEEVPQKIADADIVLCNKTLLDENTLKYAKNLKYIGLFATGYNNIDIETLVLDNNNLYGIFETYMYR